MYDPQFAVLRALLSLCATLGLIVICGWAWRTYGQNISWLKPNTPRARRLQVIETQRLTTTTTLHLVKLGTTELLLSTTAAQTTLIHTTENKKSAKVKS